jgi:hypothetical protein
VAPGGPTKTAWLDNHTVIAAAHQCDEFAIGENVVPGNAMLRRAGYAFRNRQLKVSKPGGVFERLTIPVTACSERSAAFRQWFFRSAHMSVCRYRETTIFPRGQAIQSVSTCAR